MLNLLTNKLLIMNNDTVKEINVLFYAKRTRIIGIAILVGLFFVFLFGIFVSPNNINPELIYINHFGFILCMFACTAAVFTKKNLIKKVTAQNIASTYFSTHILSFALCDAGGIICITANLFINQNLIYATTGFLVTAAVMISLFPKNDDYKKLGI